jgi:chromosome segregation ATPase
MSNYDKEINSLLSQIEHNPQNYDGEFITFAKNKLAVESTPKEFESVITYLTAILENITLEEYNKGTLNEDEQLEKEIEDAFQFLEEEDSASVNMADNIKHQKEQIELKKRALVTKIQSLKAELQALDNSKANKTEELKDARDELGNINRA